MRSVRRSPHARLRMQARLEIPPCNLTDASRLERELGVSSALAQVLVRRGLGEPAAAHAFLVAEDAHDPSLFAGIDQAVDVILRHVRDGTQITVHGDYDVDGVSSTSILMRVLRSLGAQCDWFLPSRTEDGYGLAMATVERLAERGTRLLLTADCAITAVDEVAAALAAGIDVVVTDHHQARADGVLPAAPIVHPSICGYPCRELCATAVAYKLARALLSASGRDPAEADVDLDLVALATVADCVPLIGENRRLVRDGLAALAVTRRPGLRALMRVAECDPSRVDARMLGFRLAPRINAAGRLHRADAGVELMLTDDPGRAEAIAKELDAANAERRFTEQRILFEAEAQAAEQGDRVAYVLAGEGWHPGVIGIVASRIAERHHRPAVVIALDGETGTGSGRSIPAFDLLGGLNACAEHLQRHGGHRAAAGCAIAAADVDAFRAAFEAHAASVLAPEDLVALSRVDAVVAGGELGTDLAEDLERLAPFGQANPEPVLLVPAARLLDPRPMGEGKHVRFTVESGGVRAKAVAFGMPRLPDGCEDGLDATFGLELNEWNGAVEPRLVLREAVAPRPAAVELLDGELLPPEGRPPDARDIDRRGLGVAGTLGMLSASGERVLALCADAPRWAAALAPRLGGFTIAGWEAAAEAARFDHVIALEPPPFGLPDMPVVLAWGEAEEALALAAHRHRWELRPHVAALYRALRDGTGAALPRAELAICILEELGLAEDGLLVADTPRTELERAATFAEAERLLAVGLATLGVRAGPAAPVLAEVG
jgi:single-stranded-DNA-specific exonuclease